MSDEPKKRSRAWIRWAALAGIALYPLLAGPSILIVGNTDSSELLHLHSIIFAPLDWARDHSVAVDNAYCWYIHLWVPPEPDVPDE